MFESWSFDILDAYTGINFYSKIKHEIEISKCTMKEAKKSTCKSMNQSNNTIAYLVIRRVKCINET